MIILFVIFGEEGRRGGGEEGRRGGGEEGRRGGGEEGRRRGWRGRMGGKDGGEGWGRGMGIFKYLDGEVVGVRQRVRMKGGAPFKMRTEGNRGRER